MWSSARLLLVGFTYPDKYRGTIWASQVLWCFSSRVPRSCPTPADPRQPHHRGCSVLASGTPIPSPPAPLTLTRLFQASGTAVSLTACVIPCVRFNRFVRSLTPPPHGCNTRYE